MSAAEWAIVAGVLLLSATYLWHARRVVRRLQAIADHTRAAGYPASSPEARILKGTNP